MLINYSLLFTIDVLNEQKKKKNKYKSDHYLRNGALLFVNCNVLNILLKRGIVYPNALIVIEFAFLSSLDVV